MIDIIFIGFPILLISVWGIYKKQTKEVSLRKEKLKDIVDTQKDIVDTQKEINKTLENRISKLKEDLFIHLSILREFSEPTIPNANVDFDSLMKR